MSLVYSFEKGNFTDKYDEITSGGYVIAARVDGHVYKSYDGAGRRAVPLKDHIKCMIEANAGAHYYAHGPYTDQFSRVSTRIDLKKLKLRRRDAQGRPCRNAYFCLGYISGGKLWHIDTGLANNQEKDTWSAFLCDFGLGAPEEVTFQEIARFNTGNYPAAAYFETGVDVGACTEKSDVVRCFYRFLDENLKNIGEITATMTRPAGDVFVRVNQKPLLRFVRFISLVPRTGKPEGDDADGTFLEGALENLMIDENVWTEDNLDYVWSVQASNISKLKVSGLGDSACKDGVDFLSLSHDKQLS